MRWVVLPAVLVLLAACGPGDPAGSPGDGAEPLEATEWVLVGGVPVVEGYPITLRVAGGEVGGTAACNSYGGTVAVAGDTLTISEVANTEMGCPEPGVHDSESAYLSALATVERYELVDGRLVLLGPGVELRFEEVPPVEDAPLTGVDWRLESLVTGTGPDGAASSTMADAMVRLDDGGAFHATDGCNDLDGRWALDDDVLVVSEVVTTDAACPLLEQQVEHIHDVLLGEPAVVLAGRRLLLTAGDRALDYRAP